MHEHSLSREAQQQVHAGTGTNGQQLKRTSSLWSIVVMMLLVVPMMVGCQRESASDTLPLSSDTNEASVLTGTLEEQMMQASPHQLVQIITTTPEVLPMDVWFDKVSSFTSQEYEQYIKELTEFTIQERITNGSLEPREREAAIQEQYNNLAELDQAAQAKFGKLYYQLSFDEAMELFGTTKEDVLGTSKEEPSSEVSAFDTRSAETLD